MARWICRTWTQTSCGVWTSTMDSFETEEEANEYGIIHCELFEGLDELARDYEVYKLD